MDQNLTLVPVGAPKVKKFQKGTKRARKHHRTSILEWSFFNIKGKWQKRHDSDISSESDVAESPKCVADSPPPQPETPPPVAEPEPPKPPKRHEAGVDCFNAKRGGDTGVAPLDDNISDFESATCVCRRWTAPATMVPGETDRLSSYGGRCKKAGTIPFDSEWVENWQNDMEIEIAGFDFESSANACRHSLQQFEQALEKGVEKMEEFVRAYPDAKICKCHANALQKCRVMGSKSNRQGEALPANPQKVLMRTENEVGSEWQPSCVVQQAGVMCEDPDVWFHPLEQGFIFENPMDMTFLGGSTSIKGGGGWQKSKNKEGGNYKDVVLTAFKLEHHNTDPLWQEKGVKYSH